MDRVAAEVVFRTRILPFGFESGVDPCANKLVSFSREDVVGATLLVRLLTGVVWKAISTSPQTASVSLQASFLGRGRDLPSELTMGESDFVWRECLGRGVATGVIGK